MNITTIINDIKSLHSNNSATTDMHDDEGSFRNTNLFDDGDNMNGTKFQPFSLQ